MTLAWKREEGWQMMINWETLKKFAATAAFFAFAQACNLLANIFIGAGLKKVLAQLRIPTTAFMSRYILGTGYTNLQWMV